MERPGRRPRSTGCPSASPSTRSAPATACRTRRPSSRPRSRPSWSRGCWTPGCRSSRRRRFVHPKWVPQLADAAELMTQLRLAGRPRPRPARCWCPTSAASTARSSWAVGTSRSSAAPPRRSRPRTSTARSTGSSRCSSRPYAARATRASTYGPTCRCASATRGRATYPIEQVVAVGKRLFDLGAAQLSIGDTIGVGTAGHVTALVDAFVAAGPADRAPGDALPRHLRPGAGQHPRRPAQRDHHLRRQRRRPRRLPLRQERHRQPGHRGPGLDAHRPRHRRTASTSPPSSPPAPGSPVTSAAPAPAPSYERWPADPRWLRRSRQRPSRNRGTGPLIRTRVS